MHDEVGVHEGARLEQLEGDELGPEQRESFWVLAEPIQQGKLDVLHYKVHLRR